MTEKEYVVYRLPAGDIYVDWNGTLWKYKSQSWSGECLLAVERWFNFMPQ